MDSVVRKAGSCKLCLIESELVDNSRYCRSCRNLKCRALRYKITDTKNKLQEEYGAINIDLSDGSYTEIEQENEV